MKELWIFRWICGQLFTQAKVWKPTSISHCCSTGESFLKNILKQFGCLGVALLLLLLLWRWLLSVLLMGWLLRAHRKEPLAQLSQTLGLNGWEVANQKFAHTGYTNTWKRERKILHNTEPYYYAKHPLPPSLTLSNKKTGSTRVKQKWSQKSGDPWRKVCDEIGINL